MITSKDKKQIVELVESGINIDIISNELKISKEKIQQYIDEVLKPEKKYKKLSEVSNEDKKTISQLLKANYSTELISYELGIRIEDLETFKENEFIIKTSNNEISENSVTDKKIKHKKEHKESEKNVRTKSEPKETNNNSNNKNRTEMTNKEIIQTEVPKKQKTSPKRSINSYSDKMALIREKYQELYNKTSFVNNLERKAPKPTQEEEKKADQLIKNLESKTNGLEKMTARNKLLKGNEILEILKDFYDLPCTSQHANKVRKLLANRELSTLKLDLHDNIDKRIGKARYTINRKLADIIETEAFEANDVETMSNLIKKISYDMEKQDYSITSLKYRIQAKLNHLIQRESVNRLKNDISNEIIDITRCILSPDMDEEEVKTKIDKEAQKLLDKSPKKGFCILKREDYKSQVYMKIRSLLSDRAEEFPIEAPHIIINRLQKVSNTDFDSSFRCVVNNFVARKDYESAKNICSQYIQKPNRDTCDEPPKSIFARKLKREIIGRELGNIILDQINTRSIDDEIFMKTFEDKLSKENVKLSIINLGKNKEGTKTITLSDIWYERCNQEK